MFHPSDEEAIDTIDAMVFSGDSLHNEEAIKRFSELLARWQRGLQEAVKTVEELKAMAGDK